MKKLLVLMSIMCFAAAGVNAAENAKPQAPATAQEIQKSNSFHYGYNRLSFLFRQERSDRGLVQPARKE